MSFGKTFISKNYAVHDATEMETSNRRCAFSGRVDSFPPKVCQIPGALQLSLCFSQITRSRFPKSCWIRILTVEELNNKRTEPYHLINYKNTLSIARLVCCCCANRLQDCRVNISSSCRLNSSTSSSEEEIEMAKATGSKMVVLKRDRR